MKLVRTVLSLSLVLALGCGKKEEEKAAAGKATESGGEAAGGEAAGGEAAGGMADLPTLGLKAELPSGAQVEDAIVGEGHMITGPGITVTIEPMGDKEVPSMEATKAEATDLYSAMNIKEEQLEDGYIVTFENKGSMGTNYWLEGYRTIGGASYKCSVTAPQDAHQKSGLAICKSLTK